MRRLATGLLALAATGTALANDTSASTAAGGLVLEHTDAIDMRSEDLFVSADEIRVRYDFRNESGGDVETIVAFPMPDRDLSREWESDVAYPSDFHTMVEGRAVATKLERKAVVKGQDHTALLNRLGIPIAPDNLADATKAMDRLPDAEKARLRSLGLARIEEFSFGSDEPTRHLVPLWTVQDKHWWRQRFPAGRDLLVEHRYVPGAGGSVESPVAIKEYRNSHEARDFLDRYCVDREFLAAVDRAASRNGMDGAGMPDRRIAYILKTGANWRSPIGSFRLVVDKGKPANLVSFCGTGVKKISPTQFEVRRKDWRPTKDLNVLVIEPQRR